MSDPKRQPTCPTGAPATLAIVQSTVRISECAGRRASDAATRQNKPMRATKKQSRSDAIRVLGKTVRLRDKDHRRFVLRQACLVCGRVPSDPHHLTFTQPRALGRRVSDEFIVPVCRVHHRELHRSGNEAAWWRKLNIDPIPIALRLWAQTRTDGGQSDPKLWKNARSLAIERFPRNRFAAGIHLVYSTPTQASYRLPMT